MTRPLEITHGEMNAATDQGHAVPLSHGQGWLIRYRDDWWIEWENGWLRVTDDDTMRDLDMIAGRLAAVGELAAQDDAERAAAREGPIEDDDHTANVKRGRSVPREPRAVKPCPRLVGDSRSEGSALSSLPVSRAVPELLRCRGPDGSP